MDQLLQKSDRKINSISTEITRYLYDQINHKNRITIIKGARGVGKTTLLLQYARKLSQSEKNLLYVSLDDLFFQKNSLYELADEFVKNNGFLLLLDEVHKYPNWSRELKLIYDDFPELNLIVTSSSILEIYKSEADLSRRAISYTLKELSFREFLIFERGLTFEPLKLTDLITNHKEISLEIATKIKPLYEFKKFTQKGGMYPFYWEGDDNYYDKLSQIINLILEVDLTSIESLEYNHIVKLKRLLFAISTSPPFTPNILKLSERIGMSRQALIKALHYLERARLIIMLNRRGKGTSILSKPDKIFLNNPNIYFSMISDTIEIGSVRESFLVNQLFGLYPVELPEYGDFYVDNKYTLELGGKNKTQAQIQNIPDSYVVKDNIENGSGNIIPLWMFGFLY